LAVAFAVVVLILSSFSPSISETVTYTYDAVNRLVRETYDSDTVIDYAYNEVGNRTERMAVGPIRSLFAYAKSGMVQLKWRAFSGSQSYNIYRSTTEGGPYSLIASGFVTSYSAYLDRTVTNGVTYYYVVSWNTTGGYESLMSNEVYATPTAIVR
jgi:YD repeat-containing protein